MRRKLILSTFCFTICLPACAAVIASDDFSGYANSGSIVGQTPLAGSTGFSNSWTAASGVVGTTVSTDGSVATTANGAVNAAAHNLTSTIPATGQVYFSIDYNPSVNSSFFGLPFFSGAGATGSQVAFVGDTSAATTWMAFVTTHQLSGTLVATGVTTTVAGVFDYANDKLLLWVNPSGSDGYDPSIGGGTARGADLDTSLVSTDGIASIRLSAGTLVDFDNLVIADSPLNVGLVPESSVALIGGIGLLGLLRRRRTFRNTSLEPVTCRFRHVRNRAPSIHAFMKSGFLLLLLAPFAQAVSISNVDMLFTESQTYTRAGTWDWPDTPDQGAVVSADFLFSDGSDHVWKLNDGAQVILQQTSGQAGGRFFPGAGGYGVLTFTCDAGTPGRICARYNDYAAMRIGQGNDSGTVNVDGGVVVEIGWIFGEGAGQKLLNVRNGECRVFSGNPAKRLNGIAVTLSSGGTLWIQDAGGAVTSAAAFSSFAPGATISANGNGLVFTNDVSRTSLLGSTPVIGTTITAAPPSAPVIMSQPVAANAMEFGPHSFSVAVAGTQPFTFQWMKNGTEIDGATSATLELPNLSTGDAGVYAVKVTNAFGDVTSDSVSLAVQPYPRDLTEAGALIGRLLPDIANHFTVEFVAPENGADVFEIDNAGDRIVLRGNNGVSVASALKRYLADFCGCHFSRNGDQLDLPVPLPRVDAPLRVVSPHKVRYFYNPCTFGYTSAWWTWPEWEREIDLLALDGVNLAQVTPGNEEVWRRTLRDHFGYTDAEVRAWLCMPTHLPWMLLGNMHSFDGPVPASLIDKRLTLGQQMVSRMRSLGIEAVLPGFYGMVPQDFKTRNPTADVRGQGGWVGGFQRPDMLNPTDPLFTTFAEQYYSLSEMLFPGVRHFAADPFHEGGSTTGIDLAAAAVALVDGMSHAQTDAVWVAEAWSGNPRSEMLDAVADDRVLVLDLNASNVERWRQTDAFRGKPWVWCAIQNFGGNTGMAAKLGAIASRPAAALADPGKGKMVGIGAVPEASHTIPAAYELLLDQSWQANAIDPAGWIAPYARRRYGKITPSIQDAWQLLLRSNMDLPAGATEEPHNSIVTARPGLAVPLRARTWSDSNIPYDPTVLARAWRILLDASADAGGSDGFRFDLADVTRQALADLATRHQRMLGIAVAAGDAAAVHEHGDRILEIIADLDTLCATRPEWLLGTWLEDARSWGDTPQEKDLCEHNARVLLTTWSDSTSNLNDYANREWAGLLGGFYLPRWQQFMTALYDAVDGGGSFDESAVRNQIAAWELTWADGHEAHATIPAGDTLVIAEALWTKYGAEATDNFGRLEFTVGNTWSPAVCSTLPVAWNRDVSSVINQPGTWIVAFQYTAGSHALRIREVSLENPGGLIDTDAHEGWTGLATYDNRFYLKVTDTTGPLTLHMNTSGAGGVDSNGTISIDYCPERSIDGTWAPADCSTDRSIWSDDVSGSITTPGMYEATFTRGPGTGSLTIDRVWLEQGGVILARQIGDETLSSEGAAATFTLKVSDIPGGAPILLKAATGSSSAAGTEGAVSVARNGDLSSIINPVEWTDWAGSHGLVSSAPASDSDDDGLADLLEFFFGRNPWIPDAEPPLRFRRDGSDLVLGFDWIENRVGALLVIEKSGSLTGWRVAGDDLVWLSDAPLGNGRYHRSYRIEPDSAAMFYRLAMVPID